MNIKKLNEQIEKFIEDYGFCKGIKELLNQDGFEKYDTFYNEEEQNFGVNLQNGKKVIFQWDGNGKYDFIDEQGNPIVWLGTNKSYIYDYSPVRLRDHLFTIARKQGLLKSRVNEKLKKCVESNLSQFQKIDKLCDLDKHLSESGRYIGMKDSKYGIYRYERTTQKFNGSWNYDYKLISPEFAEELDAIDWLAQDLLSNNSKQDFIDCIKDGSFKIYNDNLKTIMDLDVEEGTLNNNPKFPTGDNKGIDPIPNYMLEPNKAKANNLKRQYMQTHGKTYESLNKELEKFVEKINTEDELEMDKEDVEEMIDSIIKAIPQITYYYIYRDNMTSSTFRPEKREGYYNIIDFKGYLYGETKSVATIVIKSYGKKVRVRFGLPYPKHGDFSLPAYMKKYAVSDDYNSFVISYFEETKEEIVEDVVENFKRIFDYDSKIKNEQEKLQSEFEKIRQDILHTILLKHSDKNDQVINLLDLDLNCATVFGKDKLKGLAVQIYPDKDTLEQKCRYTHFGTVNGNRINLDSTIDRKFRTESMLEAFKKVLKFLTGEDDKEALKKAKRQEYNRKRQAEKKAQKLADSKPFDKFLQELKDKYGSGYIAQDVYGYTYVYKNKPYFEPTKEGYRGEEEFYEPGYWEGDRVDNIDYESKLNQAYKDQYRQDTPSAEKAIWSF